jgi:alanine dehydrogenase
MRIGVPKEIKDHEYRVAATPEGVARLTAAGHAVRIEASAGAGAGFADEAYARAGAAIVTAAQAWDAELIVKVKEPLESEYGHLRGQVLFTYLHLAGVTPALTEALLASNTTSIAYETVQDAVGARPLLAPMSAIAGNMSVVVGSYYLMRAQGGRGTQLGRVLGERHGKVVVLGDGIVGMHAARTAAAMGTHVFVGGRNAAKRCELATRHADVSFFESTPSAIASQLVDADLLVGAVLVPGAHAPRLVTEAMVRRMPQGAVIVDVSIDQGGCVETARATSHSAPTYVIHDVIHYCVPNMPGAYPRTSAIALTSATLPYVERLATGGLDAVRADTGFARGVQTYRGAITSLPVAQSLNLNQRYRPFEP